MAGEVQKVAGKEKVAGCCRNLTELTLDVAGCTRVHICVLSRPHHELSPAVMIRAVGWTHCGIATVPPDMHILSSLVTTDLVSEHGPDVRAPHAV